MASSPASGPAWADRPPAWALPVTLAGDLVLVREPGVLACVEAICVYPNGFLFYLLIGLDPARTPPRAVQFHLRTPEERMSAARLRVGYSNGQVADSFESMTSNVTPGKAVLRFSGGHSVIRSDARCRGESMWWVSPLPPPGPVEFAVFLQPSAQPAGTAHIDADQITRTAARSQTLWEGTGSL